MELEAQLLATWRRHHDILLFLFDHVPAEGFAAVPLASRGRDVARQFEHLQRVRMGWLAYHETGKRPSSAGETRGSSEQLEDLREALADSGCKVEQFLTRAFRGEAKVRMFGRNPVRWMGYLISHESHHRGQILLALKQNGMRLPEKIALQGLWGKWINGSDELPSQ